MINYQNYLYHGCGNKVLIHSLEDINAARHNKVVRAHLARIGKKLQVDSIMVITGHPQNANQQGYHCTMDVFEPRGKDGSGLAGSWSTMCGNGIRAVARYFQDTGFISVGETLRVKTASGLREVEVLKNYQYKVNMGELTLSGKNMSRYVKFSEFTKLKAKNSLATAIVGFVGESDGEPHLVIFAQTKKHLQKLANKYGKQLTTNRLIFPQEINTNVVVMNDQNKDTPKVSACTYERGIYYVTQACGTGASVIGGYLLKKHPSARKVRVKMPGGTLSITKKGNQIFMQGPAKPYKVK